jgi:excisionase family DNA binding protein
LGQVALFATTTPEHRQPRTTGPGIATGARKTGDQSTFASTTKRCFLHHEVSERESGVTHANALPIFLKPDEVADLLRTTRGAIYAMIERRQLPGVSKIGKRILVRSAALLEWVDQQAVSSLPGEQR